MLALFGAVTVAETTSGGLGVVPETQDSSAVDAKQSVLRASGFDDAAVLAGEMGDVDAREALEWALSGGAERYEDAFNQFLMRFVEKLKSSFLDVVTSLAIPALSCLALRMLLGNYRGSEAAALLCRVVCATLLMARFAVDSQVAEEALRKSSKLASAFSPVLASVMTMAGSDSAAALLSPASTLSAMLVQRVLEGVALPLCGVAALVAAAANLSGTFQLNRLFSLLSRTVIVGVRLTVAGFVAVMALEGMLISGQEGTAMRALQHVMRDALPVIGGQLSDSAGALLGSAAALKNAVGVAGMAVILGACVAPAVHLTASMLSLRLAAAVLEPIADSDTVKIVAHFSTLSQTLLAICVGCAALSVLLIGTGIGFAGIVAG